MRTVHNKCAHNPNIIINDNEFNGLWNEAVSALVASGESEEELELLKNESKICGNESQNGVNEGINLKVKELKELGKNSNRSIAYLILKLEMSLKSGPICVMIDHNDFRYKALSDAKQSLELRPIWWRAYYRVGTAYHALNKFQKAIHFFDREFAIESTNDEVRNERDSCRSKAGREERYEFLDSSKLPQSSVDLFAEDQ